MAEKDNNKYIYAIGRRKTATAQVRLHPNGEGKITVNEKEMEEYFDRKDHQERIRAPFRATGTEGMFDVTIRTQGGGITGQTDSILLGIARALLEYDENHHSALKSRGYLTRDSRKKERKKYGRLGARRSPQWSKR